MSHITRPSRPEVHRLAELLTGQSSDEVPPLSAEAALESASGALAALYIEAEHAYPALVVRAGFQFAAEPGSGIVVVSVWDGVMWRTIGAVGVEI